jgi:hypothetical protein
VAALLLASALVGCAATGPKFTQVAASLPAVPAEQGRIYFLRTSGVGAAVQPDVRLNGVVVGKSRPGSFFFVDRPAGRYTASARTEVESRAEFDLADGQTVYVQTSIGLGVFVGHPRVVIADEGSARAALPELAYIGETPLSPATAGRSEDRSGPSVGSRAAGPVTMEDLSGLLPAKGR